MSTAIAALAAAGIVRPDEVLELADAAKLPRARGVVMLVKESSGGHNLWGRDAVLTGGAYTKGGPVTEANYLAYRALVQAKRIGRQGVGPAQLTYHALQDLADRRGGCWDWRTNVAVGFEHLAELQRRHGVRAGFVAYNGGEGAIKKKIPAAETYADKSMALLATWEKRLADAPAQPELRYGMRKNADVARLQAWLAETFPLYAGHLPATGNYLDETVKVVAEFQRRAGVTNADGSRPDGRNVHTRTYAALALLGYR